MSPAIAEADLAMARAGMMVRRRIKTTILAILALAVCAVLLSYPQLPFSFLSTDADLTHADRPSNAVSDPTAPARTDVEIVLAKLRHEDTDWTAKYLPYWPRSIYVVDDPGAAHTVPMNKGREAMVILT